MARAYLEIFIFHIIMYFPAVCCTGRAATYKIVATGSYDMNDMSVTMVNYTEPWMATNFICSVR